MRLVCYAELLKLSSGYSDIAPSRGVKVNHEQLVCKNEIIFFGNEKHPFVD